MPPSLRLASIVIGLLSVATPAAAQEAAPDRAAEVRAAERALADAMHARDAAALERLLAPGYRLRSSPDIDRATWIRNALTLCWGDRSDFTDVEVRAYDDTAVASFVLTFYVNPTTCMPATLRSLITDLWVREADGWRLAVRHSGPVPSSGAGLAAQYGVVPELPPVWDARGELSAVGTTGNSSTRTIGLASELVHRTDGRTTRASVSFLTSEADEVTRARSINAQARHGFRVRERLEIFGRVEYARDTFAGIQNRETVEAGASYKAALPPRHELVLEPGGGFTIEDRAGVRDLKYAIATTAIRYAWTPRPGARLENALATTADLETLGNWRSTNALSFTMTLTRVLSLKASHGLEYRNQPVPGFRRADTRTSVALVLSVQRRPAAAP
jgi:putative salt-induced outer membrane protein YdiY/ketosteroid isomerase-like protein